MKTRWLTFEELSAELRLPAKTVRKLVKKGKILGICHGRKSRVETDWRFIDPSEQFKRALQTQEELLSRSFSVNLMEFPVISPAEFAELVGVTQSRIRGLIFKRQLHPFKIGRYSLFTPAQVREYMLKRERREPQARRARCALLLEWITQNLDDKDLMSAEEIDADDRLEGTLNRLLQLKEPHRTKAVNEFWRRYRVVKEFSALLQPEHGSDPSPHPGQ